jgi:putative flavoprotein involved in K+ transport
MRPTDTVIIGGGQAGLAMSRCLSERSIEHVILERGQIAQRWRTERWDSLRLLTPNWQSRLPGWRYAGADPHGFMSMPQIIAYLAGYARSFAAPVVTETSVRSVRAEGRGYRVITDRGDWQARTVVIATGHCDLPLTPSWAAHIAPSVQQLTPNRYRNPQQLAPGNVLVVGASATGIQLADELVRAGREVTLAVGRHTRLPRTYCGRDVMWWMDRAGILDQRYDQVGDIAAARRQPSLQLVGADSGRSLDLAGLRERGVRLVGRAVGAHGAAIGFAGDLAQSTSAADAKLYRLLDRIDAFARRHGMQAEPARRPPAAAQTGEATTINLHAEGITTVLWATGFRRDYSWLHVPVVDGRGELRHRGGVVSGSGLYVLGLQFMRRRKSSFIDGVACDAADLAAHIDASLRRGPARAGRHSLASCDSLATNPSRWRNHRRPGAQGNEPYDQPA